MTSTNIDVIHRYFAAINAEDWEALARLWHPEAEWRATGARRRDGKDDLLTYYPRALALYPQHHDDPVRIIDAGETVTVEIVFTGRTRDDKPVRFDAVDVFDFEGGLIRRFSSWFDIDELRAQL
jgi:ketosteroid isomerase-like protein